MFELPNEKFKQETFVTDDTTYVINYDRMNLLSVSCYACAQTTCLTLCYERTRKIDKVYFLMFQIYVNSIEVLSNLSMHL